MAKVVGADLRRAACGWGRGWHSRVGMAVRTKQIPSGSLWRGCTHADLQLKAVLGLALGARHDARICMGQTCFDLRGRMMGARRSLRIGRGVPASAPASAGLVDDGPRRAGLPHAKPPQPRRPAPTTAGPLCSAAPPPHALKMRRSRRGREAARSAAAALTLDRSARSSWRTVTRPCGGVAGGRGRGRRAVGVGMAGVGRPSRVHLHPAPLRARSCAAPSSASCSRRPPPLSAASAHPAPATASSTPAPSTHLEAGGLKLVGHRLARREGAGAEHDVRPSMRQGPHRLHANPRVAACGVRSGAEASARRPEQQGEPNSCRRRRQSGGGGGPCAPCLAASELIAATCL